MSAQADYVEWNVSALLSSGTVQAVSPSTIELVYDMFLLKLHAADYSGKVAFVVPHAAPGRQESVFMRYYFERGETADGIKSVFPQLLLPGQTV